MNESSLQCPTFACLPKGRRNADMPVALRLDAKSIASLCSTCPVRPAIRLCPDSRRNGNARYLPPTLVGRKPGGFAASGPEVRGTSVASIKSNLLLQIRFSRPSWLNDGRLFVGIPNASNQKGIIQWQPQLHWPSGPFIPLKGSFKAASRVSPIRRPLIPNGSLGSKRWPQWDSRPASLSDAIDSPLIAIIGPRGFPTKPY